MDNEPQDNKLIAQLQQLNDKMEHQGMMRYQLRDGILKGIGFFMGSAIIATILLGILGPVFGDIEWVRDTYEVGESILRP